MENILFVSTLPFSATSKDLEAFFSEVGPLRSCFVVADKNDPSKNNGCGFVTFVLADDAAKAISALKKKKFMDLRFLKIQFARKKVDDAPIIKDSNQASAINHSVYKQKSVSLTALPTNITQKQLYKKVKKYGTVSGLKFTAAEDHATVDYKTYEEATNAVKHLNDHVFKGVKIQAELIYAKKERYRLFLKNLHFQCTDQDIRKIAAEYGTIKDISIPSKNENRSKGFAFLEYHSKEDCEKAITGIQGKKIRGREVSIEWAVSKQEYSEKKVESCVEEAFENHSHEEENEPENEQIDDIKMDDDEDHDEREEDDQDETINTGDNPKVAAPPTKKLNGLLEGTTLFIRNLSYDSSEEELIKCFSVFGKLRYARITRDPESGHSRGTGFICYFQESDAKTCMDSYTSFMDTSAADDWKESQFMRKGTIEMTSTLTPEPPKSLIDSPFFLGGRLVNLSLALTRSDADKAAKEGKVKRRAEDKRNMYLIKEGVIFPDSDAAKGMSPSEISRRQKSYSERKRILALNPNLFISKTRLSIRNLNLKIDDKLLQKSAQNAVSSFWKEVKEGTRENLEPEVMEEAAEANYSPLGKKNVWIKQAKILRSNDRIDPVSKLGRSKGYGFVEFLHHCDALACLRWMNNNAHAFAPTTPQNEDSTQEKGNRQRPIVEFAVENKLVLKRRSERNRPQNGANDRKRKPDDAKTDEQPSKRVKTLSKWNNDKSKIDKSKNHKAKSNQAENSKSKNDKSKYDKKELNTRKRKANDDSVSSGRNKVKSPKKPAFKKDNSKFPSQANKKKKSQKALNLSVSREDMKKWLD